jgi:hypothetical protein
MYFPAVREAIIKLADAKPHFNRVELIDSFIDLIKIHTNPVEDIEFDFTIDSNNMIRRYVLNSFAEPGNCLLVYEATLKLLHMYDSENLSLDIVVGIEYYEQLSDAPTSLKDKLEADDNEKFKKIKNTWVAS